MISENINNAKSSNNIYLNNSHIKLYKFIEPKKFPAKQDNKDIENILYDKRLKISNTKDATTNTINFESINTPKKITIDFLEFPKESNLKVKTPSPFFRPLSVKNNKNKYINFEAYDNKINNFKINNPNKQKNHKGNYFNKVNYNTINKKNKHNLFSNNFFNQYTESVNDMIFYPILIDQSTRAKRDRETDCIAEKKFQYNIKNTLDKFKKFKYLKPNDVESIISEQSNEGKVELNRYNSCSSSLKINNLKEKGGENRPLSFNKYNLMRIIKNERSQTVKNKKNYGTEIINDKYKNLLSTHKNLFLSQLDLLCRNKLFLSNVNKSKKIQIRKIIKNNIQVSNNNNINRIIRKNNKSADHFQKLKLTKYSMIDNFLLNLIDSNECINDYISSDSTSFDASCKFKKMCKNQDLKKEKLFNELQTVILRNQEILKLLGGKLRSKESLMSKDNYEK